MGTLQQPAEYNLEMETNPRGFFKDIENDRILNKFLELPDKERQQFYSFGQFKNWYKEGAIKNYYENKIREEMQKKQVLDKSTPEPEK